jgi:hypothetical protein
VALKKALYPNFKFIVPTEFVIVWIDCLP